MPTPEIFQRVRKLQADLGEVRPDPAHDPAVANIRAQLDAVLREPDHAPHYKSLGDRLRLHIVEFEEDHPALAKTMESLVDALSSVS